MQSIYTSTHRHPCPPLEWIRQPNAAPDGAGLCVYSRLDTRSSLPPRFQEKTPPIPLGCPQPGLPGWPLLLRNVSCRSQFAGLRQTEPPTSARGSLRTAKATAQTEWDSTSTLLSPAETRTQTVGFHVHFLATSRDQNTVHTHTHTCLL